MRAFIAASPEFDTWSPTSRFSIARGLGFEGYFVFVADQRRTHVVISAGDLVAYAEPPKGREPDLVAFFTLPTTMVRIRGRVLNTSDAERHGQLRVEGNRDLMIELLGLLNLSKRNIELKAGDTL